MLAKVGEVGASCASVWSSATSYEVTVIPMCVVTCSQKCWGKWSYTLKRQCFIWEISAYTELGRQLLSCDLGDLKELEVSDVFTGDTVSIPLVDIVLSVATKTPSVLSAQAQCD